MIGAKLIAPAPDELHADTTRITRVLGDLLGLSQGQCDSAGSLDGGEAACRPNARVLFSMRPLVLAGRCWAAASVSRLESPS